MQRIRLQVFRHILVLRNPSWSGVGNFAEAQAGARQIVSRAQDEVQEAPPAGGAVPTEASITHLYDARGIVDKWLGHPTFWGMISGTAYLPAGSGAAAAAADWMLSKQCIHWSATECLWVLQSIGAAAVLRLHLFCRGCLSQGRSFKGRTPRGRAYHQMANQDSVGAR